MKLDLFELRARIAWLLPARLSQKDLSHIERARKRVMERIMEENGEKKALVGTEFLTWQEHGQWVAAWVRRDIVTQGDSEAQAVERLMRTIAHTWVLQEMHPEAEDVPKPSSERVEKWRELHEACHK